MNKKGISAIVATVLIILITVAAVTIIWAAIIPIINEGMYTSYQRICEGKGLYVCPLGNMSISSEGLLPNEITYGGEICNLTIISEEVSCYEEKIEINPITSKWLGDNCNCTKGCKCNDWNETSCIEIECSSCREYSCNTPIFGVRVEVNGWR